MIYIKINIMPTDQYNIIHRVHHFNNNNILYTSKLIDSVTSILPSLVLLIMPIHCSLIIIIMSYNVNYKTMTMLYNYMIYIKIN